MPVFIEDIEEEVLSLVSQIEYGDLSDLETYWLSLQDALLRLPILAGFKHLDSVNEILSKLPKEFSDPELNSITEKMEDLSAESSSDSVEEETLSTLRQLAAQFEKRFLALLERLQHVVSE